MNTDVFCSEHPECFITNIRHSLLRTSAVFIPNILYFLTEHLNDFQSEHPDFFKTVGSKTGVT
jgi:hypothetical protein